MVKKQRSIILTDEQRSYLAILSFEETEKTSLAVGIQILIDFHRSMREKVMEEQK